MERQKSAIASGGVPEGMSARGNVGNIVWQEKMLTPSMFPYKTSVVAAGIGMYDV